MVKRLVNEYICVIYALHIRIPWRSLPYIEHEGNTSKGSISNLGGSKEREDIDNKGKIELVEYIERVYA